MDSKTPILHVYPRLAGQNPDDLLPQLTDIKTGVRKNAMTAAMAGVMQHTNGEEMRTLADWLGSLSWE